MTRATRWLAVVAGVWVTACSTSPRATQESARPAVPPCVVTAESTLSPQARDHLASFQRAVETGPLFAASAGVTGVASCRVGAESGVTSVEYQLRDGGWLRATHDPRLEYSDQEVHFAAPRTDDPVAILTRAERAAFGEQGCGIDWKTVETHTPDDDRSVVEQIYRGETCNCQARVRRDARGRILGVILRSAC
jgi:hypothetical protein